MTRSGLSSRGSGSRSFGFSVLCCLCFRCSGGSLVSETQAKDDPWYLSAGKCWQ